MMIRYAHLHIISVRIVLATCTGDYKPWKHTSACGVLQVCVQDKQHSNWHDIEIETPWYDNAVSTSSHTLDNQTTVDALWAEVIMKFCGIIIT